jgi:glucuronoarabinoxylan endo-1,4-beta-xylanase
MNSRYTTTAGMLRLGGRAPGAGCPQDCRVNAAFRIQSKWRITSDFKSFIAAALITLPGALQAASVTVEAESGALGADWAISNTVSPAYITITSNGGGNNPGSSNRVATYTVNFPAAGKYCLYAHVRVGPDTFNDDSMFFGNGFGIKSPSNNGDWVLVNGLGGVGFSNSTDVVTGGGSLGSGMWKWINLTLFTGQPRIVASSGNQIFQIGAREDGLDIDKFVFGTAGYTFTVSNLDNGTDGTPPPPPPLSTSTIDSTKLYQTIEGLGGAIAFYNGWVTAHPYKQEIYTNVFAGLNLSMLRLGNWFRYQGTSNFDPDAPGFVSNANQILGHPVPVLISSWSPPAFLKSNGQVGNGGTLLYTNGGFLYDQFAQYWYDSLVAYGANGVSPTWISFQNEPDWQASYDSCVFNPSQSYVNSTNYWAGYSNALSATYLRLASLPSPPKLLGPENVGVNGNSSAVQSYASTMNPNHFYGITHHLYGGSTDGTPDGYNTALSVLTNIFPSKPRFMTEYGLSDLIDQANLLHNVLTVEQASGYNYWSLVWPVGGNGLVEIENPFANHSTWTNAPPGTPTQSHGWWVTPAYWAMKHFSYFIQPGYRRTAAACTDTNVLASAYLSPDGLRLVAVFINRNLGPATNTMSFGSFVYFNSSVYQTVSTNGFQSFGSLSSPLVLPAESLTTVVLDKFVSVGSASNPSPASGASNVAVNTGLSWTPGSNALTHAAYLGSSSNGVAQATTASAQFKGIFTNASLAPAIFGNSTFYWRVDEIAGGNTNTGSTWAFSTAPPPALGHRYSFSETAGTTVADSIGGSAWNGTLPIGGTFSGGQLTLASSSQQYVSLPPGIVSTLTNFTIETWVKLNSTANWSRLFDFGNNTTNYMFLTPQNGSTTRARFAITTSSSGGEKQITGPSALSAGVSYHLAVTLNGNTGILYVNGVSAGTNSAMTLTPSGLGSTSNNYLGRSQWPADPYLDGVFDEFRIYNVPLSPAEIAATDALGPDQLLSTNSPSISLTPTATNLTLSWPVGSAGFTVQSRTNLVLGNWLNVNSPAPQIVSDQWQVTLPLPGSAGSLFYRLAK